MKYPQLVSMPSAVSDWLEEQLEARGIDAVLYTRYILSLLHSHTVDVIYPDEDLQFSHLKKEVKRSTGGRKRFRRSSEWWRHARADAEQIKRSAAVECLMSASDQNCEIESLVDELFEKLKEVDSESSSPMANASDAISSQEPQKQKITPQELAEKYYAAFPPLCRKSPSKMIPLFPKWTPNPCASPFKKKNVRKPQNKSDTIKARTQNKPRFNYFARARNGIWRRNVEKTDNLNNWDLCAFNNNSVRSSRKYDSRTDQCVDGNRDIWSNEDEMNMYEDLPVDIKELLDSPTPQDDSVEMMNMANMRDDGKRDFIPYRTNITNSIWSNDQETFDNKFNASVECADSESMLDFQFKAISIDGQESYSGWPYFSPKSENETNSLFETNAGEQSILLGKFRSLPDDWTKESAENKDALDHLAASLVKLNHSKENSCFVEIIPRSQFDSQIFNPFSKTTSMFSFNSRRNLGFDHKEDLLTSEHSHFKPINEKQEHRVQGQYADGATFVISNSLDKVEYKRSDSGSMLLDTEFGQTKKYWVYRLEEPNPRAELVLKFSVSENNKACQTEELSSLDLETTLNCRSFDGYRCASPAVVTPDIDPVGCVVPPARPESMLGEIVWKYDVKTCEKCNNGSWNAANWSRNGRVDSEWDNQSLRDIWNGGEICESCLSLNDGGDRPAPSLQNTQLREDISLDGEQLLSDLSSIQKSYMEDLPVTELSYVPDPVQSAAPKERKRRHSFMASHVEEAGLHNRSSWSFASRLEEDCLIQMSTLPTLRSVTL